jgi:hypothetical protein
MARRDEQIPAEQNDRAERPGEERVREGAEDVRGVADESDEFEDVDDLEDVDDEEEEDEGNF